MSPARVRLALLKRALAGLSHFRLLPLEIRRRGPSYTVDTLEELCHRHPAVEWWLLVGSDMLRDLPNWRDPERVTELAGIAVMDRPGYSARWPARLRRRHFRRIDAPQLDISSSELRRRVRRGAPIRFLVPDAVANYIGRQKLYRGAGRGERG